MNLYVREDFNGLRSRQALWRIVRVLQEHGPQTARHIREMLEFDYKYYIVPAPREMDNLLCKNPRFFYKFGMSKEIGIGNHGWNVIVWGLVEKDA